MRFRRRLGAAILAVVMMVSSIQIPGGTSYAAGTADSSMESGYDASILTAEGTEGIGTAKPDNGAITDDGDTASGDDNWTGNDNPTGDGNQSGSDNPTGGNQSGDDNPAGGESQTGDDNQSGDDNPTEGNQSGDDNLTGDDNQSEDGSQSGDDTQISDDALTEDAELMEDGPEEEANAALVSGEVSGTGERIVTCTLTGALQFGDFPEPLEAADKARSFYNFNDSVDDYVYRQMTKRAEYIDLYEAECYNIKGYNFSYWMSSVVNDHPDLGFVKKEFQLVLDEEDTSLNDRNKTVKGFYVKYLEDCDLALFWEKTAEALASLTDDMTDLEKAVVLHDYLVIRCEYDHSFAGISYSAYGALVNGKAVCNGYTLAYQHLLNIVGIENYYVVSSDISHAWNLVKLGGEFYHIDVTWGDPDPQRFGRVSRKYMLCSDDGLSGHATWTVWDGRTPVDYRATDHTYDDYRYKKAFWKDEFVDVALVCKGTDFYYMNDLYGKLMKASFLDLGKGATEIADLGKECKYFSGLFLKDDRFYYNDTRNIYSIKMDGTDKRTEFTLDAPEEDYMMHVTYIRGKVYYYDNRTNSVREVDMDIADSGEYRILYNLDGGTNDSGNPQSYHSETETITLKAPTREGYHFTGWYTDRDLIYEVTEIPKGSKGHILLFAGWRSEPDNPEYTFTTIDDKTVSSRADGRPKLLVFVDAAVVINAPSYYVIKDLSEHIRAFDGVDIYAVDAFGKRTKEDVARFKNLCGCSEITFCYGKDGDYKACVEEYCNGNSVEDGAVVVLIDAQNRVQRVTFMRRSWDGILKDLQNYCGYDRYGIIYTLNGGENHIDNPCAYQSSADALVLKDPFKAGYVFEGWYTDAAFTNRVTEIAGGSRGNIRLYAKWGSRGGYYAKNGDYSFRALDDTELHSQAEGRPKLLVFYNDAEEDSISTVEEIAGIADELGWVDIYATDLGKDARDREKVRAFKDAYGGDGIRFTYKLSGERLDTYMMKWYLTAAGIEESTAALPVICYIDEWNYFQWVSLGKASGAEILENLKKYCGYSPQGGGTYKITYKLDGGKNSMGNPESYTPGTAAIDLQHPSKPGSIFEGWYKDAAFKERVTQITGESTGDLVLYAKWVFELKLNLTNHEYTFTALDDTTFTATAEGRPKLLIFYDVTEENSASTVKSIAGNIQVLDGVDIYAINVKAERGVDKSLVVQFKDTYGCDGITFSYMSNAIQRDGYKQRMESYLSRANITPLTEPIPVLCYIDKDNKLQWVTYGAADATEVLKNLKYSCGPSADGESVYRIDYWLDGGTNDWRNPEIYTPGAAAVDLKNPFKACYIFGGWYRDMTFTEQVTQIAEENTGNITLYAKWEDLIPTEEYTKLDDTKISLTANGKPKILIFNMNTSTPGARTIRGIRDRIGEFSGVDICIVEVSQLPKETVAIYKQNAGCDEMIFCYDTGEYNKNSMLAYTAKGGLVKPNFADGQSNTFPVICYIDADNCVRHLAQGQITADGILVNLREYCGYTPKEVTYRITYELDGGENDSGNPETYTFETETVILKDAVKPGYIFEGWYEDAAFRKQVFAIPQGSKGDITLYAKWRETSFRVYVINPDKTTYIVGQEPDVTGGKAILSDVMEGSRDERDMELGMLEGFDSSKSGICTVTVDYDGYKGSFQVLIVEEPKVAVACGKQLNSAVLPESPDGTYVWGEDVVLGETLGEEGVYAYEVEFIPYDTEQFQTIKLQAHVHVTPTGETEQIDGREPGSYKVTFNVQGHGKAPNFLTDVKAGDTIDNPGGPEADGYLFGGWYKDAECTKAWNFETDTVQSDMTLYAKWAVVNAGGGLAVQEIRDLYYNGKAQKPAVNVYDENTLLKAGRDYTVKYFNNINANAGGALKGLDFDPTLPYVEITGKGNYKETVKINFNIRRCPISNGGNPAAGVTFKWNEQLVKAAKPQKTFGSLKCGRNLKEHKDFELRLDVYFAYDESGKPVYMGSYDNDRIPAGYTGWFLLTVTGIGNYEGALLKSVYVADKEHLMKNAKITFGKNTKNVVYTGKAIKLKAVEKQIPGEGEFVVTCGKKVLKPDVDYYVLYGDNVGVGKAELVVAGMGDYYGDKTVNFNITGKVFTSKTVAVTGVKDMAYTGKAVVQNEDVVLTWKADGTELVYGRDYTVSYSKNINKGTATMTFAGKTKAGYSGKFSVKFKINAADIADTGRTAKSKSAEGITVPYTKAGAKPVDEIILTNERGIRLQNGKDYTLSYKNNKAVADASAVNAPTVVVKGKGNYRGSFDVKFSIVEADLCGENITIECAQVLYNSKKPDTYVYKPAVTVKDGKTKLKVGVDYEINYVNNTQADYNNYLEKLMWGSAADDGKTADDYRPVAVITAREGSAYTLQEQREVPLQIYTEKLTKTKLDVEIDPTVYTGGQIKPKVTVAYKGEGGNIPLEEGVDYTLVYGANTAAGKNKGSVTVKGLAPHYGGSVVYKFEITRKDLEYWVLPVFY